MCKGFNFLGERVDVELSLTESNVPGAGGAHLQGIALIGGIQFPIYIAP